MEFRFILINSTGYQWIIKNTFSNSLNWIPSWLHQLQVYAAKYQHMLWNQLSTLLQSPTPENLEVAMQLAEEGKITTKVQLQATCDAIDTNARAVANVISARRCI
ncbi:hypothetical protein EOD39_14646 [Acipenser ruthenus]|uniref:Uncharacterized protein n=1 Tax=Acipenser ruthenus TaxID=7906 RepID=A0A662YL56_ACIRT|nr:hypothetical protein EOD39_14646 [Acipenser ruthenus]